MEDCPGLYIHQDNHNFHNRRQARMGAQYFPGQYHILYTPIPSLCHKSAEVYSNRLLSFLA